MKRFADRRCRPAPSLRGSEGVVIGPGHPSSDHLSQAGSLVHRSFPHHLHPDSHCSSSGPPSSLMPHPSGVPRFPDQALHDIGPPPSGQGPSTPPTYRWRPHLHRLLPAQGTQLRPGPPVPGPTGGVWARPSIDLGLPHSSQHGH